jgi:hypothetical protein
VKFRDKIYQFRQDLTAWLNTDDSYTEWAEVGDEFTIKARSRLKPDGKWETYHWKEEGTLR